MHNLFDRYAEAWERGLEPMVNYYRALMRRSPWAYRRMLRPIELNHQSGLLAIEVADVRRNGVLAAELVSVQSVCAQMEPELRFGVGGSLTQSASASARIKRPRRDDASSHYRTLTPTPLPRERGSSPRLPKLDSRNPRRYHNTPRRI